MKNDHYTDFGEEISKTVKKVLNRQEVSDLKRTINRTMGHIPGMDGNPFFQKGFGDGMPPLSKEGKDSFDEKDNPPGRPDNANFHGYSEPLYRENAVQKPHRIKYKRGGSVAGILFLTFGFIGAVPTGLIALMGIAAEASFGNIPLVTALSSSFGILFLAFLVMIIFGFKFRKRSKRFRTYQKILDGRTFCTIQELSAASGTSSKFMIKDLRRMIKAGLFEEGYLDEKETCFMADYETYTQYLAAADNAKKQREAEEMEKERWASREGGAILKEAIDEGKTYIQTIKAANHTLPEEEISERLDQLEAITAKIFDYVELHPEKLPEIRKFMCYYMPITLKLVNAYQEFEQNGGNTSEIEATKLEIRGTLATINKAYENLLKKLMQTDILDVSSDISALETILAQEGLIGEGFPKQN